MSEYNYGYATDTSKLNESEYSSAAHEWAEGSVELERLLLFCLENNIKTQSCCIGHKEDDDSFIQFEFNSSNLNSIISIINRYINNENFRMTFYNEPEVISKFEVRFPQKLREYYYTDMLNLLRKKEKIDVSSLSPYMADIIEVMSMHDIANKYVEFQYVREKGKENLFFASNYPSYCERFANANEKIMWTDDGVGIESSPEIIMQVISDVKSKISQGENIETTTKKENSSLKETTRKLIDISSVKFEYSELTRENPNINKLSVELGDSIDIVAQKLESARNNGVFAFAIFNGVEIDNFNGLSSEAIVENYRNKLNAMSNSELNQDELSPEVKSRLYNLKMSESKGHMISDEDREFLDLTIGKYEQSHDEFSQTLVALDNYSNMINAKVNGSIEPPKSI